MTMRFLLMCNLIRGKQVTQGQRRGRGRRNAGLGQDEGDPDGGGRGHRGARGRDGRDHERVRRLHRPQVRAWAKIQILRFVIHSS